MKRRPNTFFFWHFCVCCPLTVRYLYDIFRALYCNEFKIIRAFTDGKYRSVFRGIFQLTTNDNLTCYLWKCGKILTFCSNFQSVSWNSIYCQISRFGQVRTSYLILYIRYTAEQYHLEYYDSSLYIFLALLICCHRNSLFCTSFSCCWKWIMKCDLCVSISSVQN